MADGPVVSRSAGSDGLVRVRGAREHNLKNVDVDVPREAMVVFTGVSGSGKSSLAFGTLYAEAQRRYLESVSPYARRLFHQMSVPEVGEITGLPPAIALAQQRGGVTTRSSVGSVTTLSNLLRMLYSRAGDYPRGQPLLYAESFSANTAEGACPTCSGLGRTYDVSERLIVPDPTLSIRERAVAAWPTAWQGQNLRDILTTLGHDVDVPWRELPKKTRDFILYSEEQPVVPVYAGFTLAEVKRALKRKEEPSYQGTFTSARRHVLTSFASSESAQMKARAAKFLVGADCPACHGKRLRPEPLSVKFAGRDISELHRLPLKELLPLFEAAHAGAARHQPERAQVVQRITEDLARRVRVLLDLGLGYLGLERSTPTLSPGELQRLRLGTQVCSSLFGVVYVLDEPSAGLHPADTQALLQALDGLKASGNSLFVVEHELEVIRRADWIVDVGPGAGELGGRVLYSGPPQGLSSVAESKTARYLFAETRAASRKRRAPTSFFEIRGVTRNNLRALSVSFPVGLLTSVTGVSGSGKSTLVSQALVELLSRELGGAASAPAFDVQDLEHSPTGSLEGATLHGVSGIKRLVLVDQKPIGRTPRSNLATYTGLFDDVRRVFASTPLAKKRRYDAGRFSFNVAKGRCETCQGEGFVMVELLFLPSVYSPCPTCKGGRFNEKTLEVTYRGKSVAEVLSLSVSSAREFFDGEVGICRSLDVLEQVGLGYLRLGQPATELSGGEAQRIKLATELQRSQRAGTLYVLDEPTTGLHPSDVERLLQHLDALVEGGATVILVEHDLQVIAQSDWVIDLGPGAGDEGGRVVVAGAPELVAKSAESATAPYLAAALG
ncbi:MAG: excinuclease ABC subunit UvrA [Myxococcales bacterium]|nr:MAG: excinuclease ABC subunit UvrA [Myxococcales bacterium]